MLRRLNTGEDPIELSIEKWEDIVNGTGRDLQADNCALCEVHRGPTSLECGDCPIVKKVNDFGCAGTPYAKYVETKLERYAKEELEFLKSLRPTPELNVVEKFREWFTALTVTEQRDLYDILALVRGPDSNNYDVKKYLTSRIRYMLGIAERPGDERRYGDRCFIPSTNNKPFPSYTETVAEVKGFKKTYVNVNTHYYNHAEEALKRLKDLGILD